jgi:hypothetical protein
MSQRTVVGTAVTDGRTCGTTCACQTASCSVGGTLDVYLNAGCVGLLRSVDTDGTCNTAGSALTAASYEYTAGSGCGVKTPAAVLGSETYTSPRTVCCSFF